MPQLHADTMPPEALSPALRHAMFALYDGYYGGTHEALFNADLDEKDYVVLLLDPGGQLRGFSTLTIMRFDFDGQPRRAIFSGDTIIHRESWGEQALPHAWCRLAGRVKCEAPALPLYWFLIVKGHRTYRYLRIFSKRYFPNWRYPTPPAVQALMDRLARLRFGAAYRPELGIVQFPRSRGHLRGAWAHVPAHQRTRPEVSYFLERNPGYQTGDELVCLTELTPGNLGRHVRKAFLEGMEACAPG